MKFRPLSLKLLKRIVLIILFVFFSLSPAVAKEAPSLKTGFGKVTWGMSLEEVVGAYNIVMKMPERRDPGGIWAFEGPSDGELTVSGEALGEADIRSVSFGIHPEYGLAIVHTRFRDANDPKFVDKLLPKWTARLGKPKAQLRGPKVIWEIGETYIELTYHTVSRKHPSPSDHLAIVNWDMPRLDKIQNENSEKPFMPDVERLRPMRRPHKEN